MAFFKDKTAALDQYLTQWLKTAGGNVSYEHSLLTNRIKFVCNKCEATQTCDSPESPEKFDYVVQEFVNLHAHRPGHERLEKELAIQKGKVLVAQAGCSHKQKTGIPSVSDPEGKDREVCLMRQDIHECTIQTD